MKLLKNKGTDRGTQLRKWAPERLHEYLVKGFTMDDQRLKNPPVAGSGVPDYFDELLERIHDIRASEQRMYLRVREMFALAGDYDTGRPKTMVFFQTIQNKLHFAATGQTLKYELARAYHRGSQNSRVKTDPPGYPDCRGIHRGSPRPGLDTGTDSARVRPPEGGTNSSLSGLCQRSAEVRAGLSFAERADSASRIPSGWVRTMPR